MKRTGIILLALTLVVSGVTTGFAQRNSSVDILRSGLLGAGAGAIGGAASGADTNDLWIGALTGAGVNIVGGSLLDLITAGNSVNTGQQAMNVRPVRVAHATAKPVRRPQNYYPQQQVVVQRYSYSPEYEDAYLSGYNAGYLKGYKEGVRER